MPNLRISYSNAVDVATLSGSPYFLTTLPAANLQNSFRYRTARTTSLADQQIKGTWATAQNVNFVMLWRHNLTAGATWRIELFRNANWTSRIYDSGWLNETPIPLGDLNWGIDELGATVWHGGWALAFQYIIWLPNTYTALSFRITLHDPENPAGYMEAARLWMGTYWTPNYNTDWGVSVAWTDLSTNARTDGGSLRTQYRARVREMAMQFSFLTDSDRDAFLTIMRSRGTSEEVFVTLYPTDGGRLERDHMVLGRFKPGHNMARNSALFWADKLVIEES